MRCAYADRGESTGLILVLPPPCLERRVLQRLRQVVGEGGSRGAGRATGDDEPLLECVAYLKGHLQPAAAVGEADVVEEHGAGADETAGVGVLDAALFDHARGAAVDRLAHGVALAA